MGRGFGITAAVDHGVVRDLAREAELLGYSSLWANDVPDADGLASLASAAAVTERISLGVGVIPLDRRPPGVIVEQARATGLPPDRLVLGIGSGGPNGALARVRDGLAELDRDVAGKVVVGAARSADGRARR